MKDFKEYENKTLNDPEFLRIRELYTGKYIKRDHVYNFVHFIYYLIYYNMIKATQQSQRNLSKKKS